MLLSDNELNEICQFNAIPGRRDILPQGWGEYLKVLREVQRRTIEACAVEIGGIDWTGPAGTAAINKACRSLRYHIEPEQPRTVKAYRWVTQHEETGECEVTTNHYTEEAIKPSFIGWRVIGKLHGSAKDVPA